MSKDTNVACCDEDRVCIHGKSGNPLALPHDFGNKVSSLLDVGYRASKAQRDAMRSDA